MSVQKKQLTSQVKTLCKDCNAFFGCQAFDGFCSSCFKKQKTELKNQRKESTQTNASTELCKVQFIKQENGVQVVVDKKPQKQQKDKKRCFACNKKVGLLGIQCKCTFVFCNGHRLPQNHECEFNHQQQLKKRLQSQLIKVQHQKINEI